MKHLLGYIFLMQNVWPATFKRLPRLRLFQANRLLLFLKVKKINSGYDNDEKIFRARTNFYMQCWSECYKEKKFDINEKVTNKHSYHNSK